MRIKARISAWLSSSVGNRIRLVSVATALGLVLVLGVAAFPLFFYQSWQNYKEHSRNSIDRIADIFEFRLSATQQALEQLANSSFIVNSFIDSAGREVYLAPTLRDFRLPINLPVQLVLFDASLDPFAGNMADHVAAGTPLRPLATEALKSLQSRFALSTIGGRQAIVLTFPIYYPPAAAYEGVLVALIDVDAMFRLSESLLDQDDCLTLVTSAGVLRSEHCDAREVWGHVSRPLFKDSLFAGSAGIALNYGEKSLKFLPELLTVFLIYLLIGLGAVAGAAALSYRAGRIFVGQLKSLSEASLALAKSPSATARVAWSHPDEIGQFVDAFNTMVDRLKGFQASLEARVDERTNELRIILDNILDGIITIDGKGTVQSFNRAAEDIFGYRADEVIGHNVKMLMPEPYHSEHDGYLTNYHKSGVARIMGIGREVSGRRKDGSVFPMDLAVSDGIQNGHPLFFGVVRDITERQRIDRMKSEFVSTVSHELRTPLTSINGSLGLVCGGALGPVTDQAKTMLDIAYKNSQRLTHLINDLLDMEKLLAGKMHFDLEVQELMPLVEQSLEGTQAYAQQYQVSLRLKERADGVRVRTDASRLQQVMSNFISNAAKFSPAGADVEVEVRAQDGRVRVAVIDHGPGIPEDFRERIFQKFSQADSSDARQKGGTGLGLAITKELIERMGGEIGFDSVPGQGACFYFELPLSE